MQLAPSTGLLSFRTIETELTTRWRSTKHPEALYFVVSILNVCVCDTATSAQYISR